MVVKNDVEQAFSLPVFSSIKIKLTLIFTILSTNSAGTSNSHCIRDACGCEYCTVKLKVKYSKLDIFIFLWTFCKYRQKKITIRFSQKAGEKSAAAK